MSAMTTVDIVGVFLDVENGASVVLLGDVGGPTRVLPIIVGRTEAGAIARAAAGVVPGRPGTHDLITELLTLVDARVEEVAITELRDGTFFAELFVEAVGGLQAIDARPSDGLALAVRSGARIVVATSVFDEAGVVVQHDHGEQFTESDVNEIVSDFGRFLSTVSPGDFDLASQPSEGEPDEDVGWGDE